MGARAVRTPTLAGVLARLWSAVREIDDAQAAAWTPLLDDDA